MSPGRIAWPDGMFSVAPTTPITRTGSPSRAIAPTAATTAAPPDMSNFISCIFAAGLIEMPPRVERDRLADEAEHRAASRPGRRSA